MAEETTKRKRNVKTRKDGSKVITRTNRRGGTVRKVKRKDGTVSKSVTNSKGRLTRRSTKSADGKITRSASKGSAGVKASNRLNNSKTKAGARMAELRAKSAKARKSGNSERLQQLADKKKALRKTTRRKFRKAAK